MLNTILVDDEPLSMCHFDLECQGVDWVNVVGRFTNPMEALAFAEVSPIDCAILDIEMPVMNGISCAHALHQLHPTMTIIFATGYDQYAFDAFGAHAIGYLLKPFEKKDMLPLLERAKILNAEIKPAVTFRTFGRFNVFVNDNVVPFKNAKAKELLALCIDHNGGVVSMEEAVDKLWPEKEYDEKVKNLYRKAVAALRTILEEHDLNGLFVSVRGSCYINKRFCVCDYFNFLEGKLEKYQGEFLFDYIWAEETNARLYELASGNRVEALCSL